MPRRTKPVNPAAPPVDVEVKDEGGLVLLIPRNEAAKQWIDENLALESWQWYDEGAAIEARYAYDIIEGMQDEGLNVVPTRRIIPEEHNLSDLDEAMLISKGIVAPPGKRAAGPAPPLEPGGPQQPGVDPDISADAQADPWGLLQGLTGEEPEPDAITPTKPLKHTIEPEIPGGPYHMVGAKNAADAYCDACDRLEANCICDPKDCDLTREHKVGHEEGGTRLTPEAAGYMELKGARKSADCRIVAIPGGISLLLGCCNKFEPVNDSVQKFSCGTCEYKKIMGNTKPLVGAAKAAEDKNMAQKSSRELLREKIAAIAKAKQARQFGRLRDVAAKEPKKAGDAFGELASQMRTISDSFSHLRANLDFAPMPKSAGPKARMAAQAKYAAEFRRLADASPEVLADALIELYRSLDEICAGVENLASNLGIELPSGEEEDFEIVEGGGMPEGSESLEETGEELESPEQQELEDEHGFEGTEEDKQQDEFLAKTKEATGGAGFVTDRDQSAEPKPVEKAEIPRSQGEAAIKVTSGLRPSRVKKA